MVGGRRQIAGTDIKEPEKIHCMGQSKAKRTRVSIGASDQKEELVLG